MQEQTTIKSDEKNIKRIIYMPLKRFVIMHIIYLPISLFIFLLTSIHLMGWISITYSQTNQPNLFWPIFGLVLSICYLIFWNIFLVYLIYQKIYFEKKINILLKKVPSSLEMIKIKKAINIYLSGSANYLCDNINQSEDYQISKCKFRFTLKIPKKKRKEFAPHFSILNIINALLFYSAGVSLVLGYIGSSLVNVIYVLTFFMVVDSPGSVFYIYRYAKIVPINQSLLKEILINEY